MAIFFLYFSLDGDSMNREALLKFSSAPKALSSWKTQARKSINLIFAVLTVFFTLFLRKASHFSQVAGTYVHTVPYTNTPLDAKIKYFFILPETQAKEGENYP